MKVLIVDDHEIIRKGMSWIVKDEKAIEEILEASTIEEALELIKKERPELLILDVNLNGINGLDLVEPAREINKDIKIAVFTGSSRRGDFERAKELNVGAYISKTAITEDISYAIKTVIRGNQFYDAKMNQQPKERIQDQMIATLTEREKEIFLQIGQGLSNLQIAEKLYISENTVKKHITSLMAKLQVKRRTEVALYATQVWRRKTDFKG